jgi:hypothetical protein
MGESNSLSSDDNEGLIGVVAVHFVFVAWFVVVHPGVKTRRVENLFALFFLVGKVHHVDDFDGHVRFLLI